MNIRFYYKYLSSRVASKWLILAVDVLLVIFSMFLASLLQIGLSVLVFEFSLWVWTTLFCVICNVCFFHLNRTYVGVIRYSSFIDISRIFISLTLGYFVVCIGNLLWIGWSGGEVLPISVILTAYIVNFSLMVCLRILVKMIHELMTFDRRHSIRVFVYGSKGSGINIAKSLRVSRSNHFRLKGFISDDTGFIGKQTMGCRVYANNESLFDILEEERVEAIIVSSEKVHRLETSGMIDRLIAEDIRILTVPPINDLGRQGVQIKRYTD